MTIDLPVIWAAIIGLGVFLYVMLDGFDLGIGLLFPFFDAKADRDVMLNTVAPVWDGNETFLVLGGAGLYGAFPVVYSTLLPANYLPLILMVIGLIFRGAAFELRARPAHPAPVGRPSSAVPRWRRSAGASCWGRCCRASDRGRPLCRRPLRLAVALQRVLRLRRADHLCDARLRLAHPEDGRRPAAPHAAADAALACALLGAMALVSLWTVMGLPAVAQRWFGSGNLAGSCRCPSGAGLRVGHLPLGTAAARGHALPADPGAVLPRYTGLVISIWPNIVPPSLTIWQASSSPSSQLFALVGTVIVLPIIPVYNALQYRVFHGKVREGDAGYH